METYPVDNGTLVNVHPIDSCLGPNCCIHNPSDHHMRSWPLWWDDILKVMHRICDCGSKHPDPDDVNFRILKGDFTLIEINEEVHKNIEDPLCAGETPCCVALSHCRKKALD